jgi:hypothetical protein
MKHLRYVRDGSSLVIRGKELVLPLGHFGRVNRVSFAMQHNCRYTDGWPSRKPQSFPNLEPSRLENAFYDLTSVHFFECLSPLR